ncbi:muellerian-inhibiting factor [Nerophis lumbriciformis]|uniref:muellerian-inhibiting factor n=1 Tax=Nerophis lumbriciformis TaxID=546530 RepID=UPI002ADF11B9|nr:muellerian-inhibiting factor-like [Nerophis lumbriciformis]
MALYIFNCGLLTLCWAVFCVAVPGFPNFTEDETLRPTEKTGDASKMTPPHSTVSHLVPQTAECFLEDTLAAMGEASENDSELTQEGLTLFGICAASHGNVSVLVDLVMKAKRKHRDGLEVMHPTEVFLIEEENKEALTLIFGLPQSPLLQRTPVLLLAFESPFSGGALDQITFSSQSLQPNTQAICVSEGTHYILLTGQASVEHQRWILSVGTKSPDMKERIKALLSGGTIGRSGVTPVLLFPSEEKSDSSSSQPLHFLCELRRFLSDVFPRQNRPLSSPLKLDSLQALPSVALGLSSSESLLAELMNSSAPTIFSFTGSMFKVRRGELAMSPGLLEELKKGLEHNVMQVMQVLRDKEGGQKSIKRLERLAELCAFSNADLPSGESQYCAFLLLKALKTVGREILPQPRATRSSGLGPVCSLRSLTVALDRYVVSPDTADINNCHGLCKVPMVKTTNHAVLVIKHIESGNVHERAPCCVPVAYQSLDMLDHNEDGTFLVVHPDVVAKECGCH